MDLFENGKGEEPSKAAPLADRMRPKGLSGFFGQTHLVGEGRLVERLLKGSEAASLVLWGPPGSGKTTLARIIADNARAEFVEFSAVLSGVKEIRDVVKAAKENLRRGKKTVLFVDEIHRFNKAQQDAFLHSVEDGTITLIGATTENPSFEINAPLLSRCKVLVLEPLSFDSMMAVLEAAINDRERGLGAEPSIIDPEALAFLAEGSHGDARFGLNSLETAFLITRPEDGVRRITLQTAMEALQKKALLYDGNGEEHYNVISAFIKSMRDSDPDGALYYLARMIEAGEDPLFICRRMVIFASEDIGNADPEALRVAIAVKDAFDFVGMPEGWIPLSHGVTYLSTAAKSNASYAAYLTALEDVKKYGALPVPLHIRNAPTRLMKELGYGKGYKYAHDFSDRVAGQESLPERLRGRVYYKPVGRGHEEAIKKRMEEVNKKR